MQITFCQCSEFCGGFHELVMYEKFSVKVEASNLNIKWSLQWNDYPAKLTDLDKISDVLPSWSILHGENILLPVLYINEANMLCELVVRDVDGQEVLKAGLYQ